MSQQIALSFASNVETLATQHQLGTPVAEYRRWLGPSSIVSSVLLESIQREQRQGQAAR